MTTDVSQDQRDDALGVIVALLQACMREDADGAELLMDGVDPRPVLGILSGLSSVWAVAAYGSPEQFSRVLAAWRPGLRIGDGVAALGPNDDLDRFPVATELQEELMRLDRTRLEMVARWCARRLDSGLQ